MPLTKTVKDICVPLAEYPHLRASATLRDAFATLIAGQVGGKRFRHALVLNERDQLVGILGMRDIPLVVPGLAMVTLSPMPGIPILVAQS